ncbi:MAG: class I SAM-dependent methyltransferase [Candidatus Latescibacterota bacterium]
MKMRRIERVLVNSPFREYFLRKHEAPRILSGMDFSGDCACLEIGSGNGAGTLLIRRFTGCPHIVSVDIDPVMTESAKKRMLNLPGWAQGIPVSGIEFRLADATSLPFPDCFFDAAFSFFVFEHIPNWRDALREVFRVLKQGGSYSFEEGFIPNRKLYFNRFFGHVPFTERELRAGLTESGFIIEQCIPGRIVPRCFVRARKR